MKKIILLLIVITAISGCKSEEQVFLEKNATAIKKKLADIDTVIEQIRQHKNRQYPDKISNVKLDFKNHGGLHEEEFTQIKKFNKKLFCPFYAGSNILSKIHAARYQLKLPIENLPEHYPRLLFKFHLIKKDLEDLLKIKYLFVHRHIKYIPPKLLPTTKGDKLSFLPGLYKDKIIVFELDTGKFIASFEFAATNSSSVNVKTKKNLDKKKLTADSFRQYLRSDLLKNANRAYGEAQKKHFPQSQF